MHPHVHPSQQVNTIICTHITHAHRHILISWYTIYIQHTHITHIYHKLRTHKHQAHRIHKHIHAYIHIYTYLHITHIHAYHTNIVSITAQMERYPGSGEPKNIAKSHRTANTTQIYWRRKEQDNGCLSSGEKEQQAEQGAGCLQSFLGRG